jgi:uncharacterized RDD family membrane protein YckC
MDERVHISTPDHVSLEFELAGAGSRFAAYLIDFVLTMLLIIAVVFAAFLAGGWVALRALAGGAGGTIGASWIWAIVVLVIFLINWGYYLFFEGLRGGSTPGKKRMGIRVIRQDGLPVGLREAALRNLVRAADILPPPTYILGGLVMHFDRRGRRLGDMLAGTYVVVEKFELASQNASGAAWAKRIEQGGSRQGLTLPRGTISAQQLALIEQFFARADAISPERRDQLIWQIAEPLLPMMNEDRESLARSPERTERCRRLLLEILELMREKKPAAAIAPVKNAPPPALF